MDQPNDLTGRETGSKHFQTLAADKSLSARQHVGFILLQLFPDRNHWGCN